MIYNNNYIALVGNENKNECSPNRVCIWDLSKSRISHILKNKYEIMFLKLNRLTLISVSKNIKIYNTSSLKKLHSIKITNSNFG